MITIETARRFVLDRLAEAEKAMHEFGSALPGHGDEPKLHLVISEVADHDRFWVFYHNTKEYLETGDINFSLIGNAPFIIDKSDGSQIGSGTARPAEYYIEEFLREAERGA